MVIKQGRRDGRADGLNSRPGRSVQANAIETLRGLKSREGRAATVVLILDGQTGNSDGSRQQLANPKFTMEELLRAKGPIPSLAAWDDRANALLDAALVLNRAIFRNPCPAWLG